jgi:hypothetical protein
MNPNSDNIHYDPLLSQFISVDPLYAKYPGVSAYTYCMNNPLIYVDPNGEEVNLADMSDEEKEIFEAQVNLMSEQSPLFKELYKELENSKEVYNIAFGETVLGDDGKPVEGQFSPNNEGGGTITFSEASTDIKGGTLSEELFHAFQHDNRNNYGAGSFNREFEAKVATTAIGLEFGGTGNFRGMAGFQNKIASNEFGKGSQILSSTIVNSTSFENSYKEAANQYSKYNRENNIGNIHYKKDTDVSPFSLQKLVKGAYDN